jgi:CRP-like cAMP-binding protein
VWVLDYHSLYQWENLNENSFSQIIQSLFKRIAVMQKRILGLMSASAAERYEAFLSVYPELPHRVPQKMIASYLGITPEALSAIRRKIAQKS